MKSCSRKKSLYLVATSNSLTWPSCNGLKDPDSIILLSAIGTDGSGTQFMNNTVLCTLGEEYTDACTKVE